MIDMDDVITDGNIMNCIEKFYQKKIDKTGIKDYKIVQELTKERTSEFWEFMKQEDFYGDVPLLKDCYEVLYKLNKKYDIYIVTAYLWTESGDLSAKCLAEKYNYLRTKLPFISPDKYIFTTYKAMLSFDIAIDDKPANLTNAKKKILYNAWHNQDINDKSMIRVYNWKEIEELLIN